MSDPTPPTVLHDIALTGEPRVLARRSATPAPGPVQPPQDPFEEARRAGFEQGRREGLQKGQEEGRARGYESGLAEGRESGAEEVLRRTQAAEEAIALRVERLDQWLATLPGQFDQHYASRMAGAENDMVALCYTVICRLLGDKLLSREAVVHGVRQAIEQCCGQGTHSALAGLMAIHVHPRDLDLLRGDAGLASWFNQAAKGHGQDKVTWVADEQVRLGGCIVRSHQGSLDARLETQLATLHELLTRGEAP